MCTNKECEVAIEKYGYGMASDADAHLITMEHYLESSPIIETVEADPIKFVSIYVNLARYLYPAYDYRWNISWLLSVHYSKDSDNSWHIRFPNIDEVIQKYLDLFKKPGTDQFQLVYLNNGKEEHAAIAKLVYERDRDDASLYATSVTLCNLFTYAFYGSYYTTGEGVYGFIRRMKHSFNKVNRKLSYMMWAQALCTTFYTNDVEMGTEEEVIKRYHLLLNPKTRCLKKTREFLYYDCFPEKDADRNYIPEVRHAMY